MRAIFKSILACFVLLLLSSSCSDNTENKAEHVWKNQTDALQSAKDMAEKLENNLEQQKQNLQQQD